MTIGRNYACGQWFVMYVNTETSLVNTVQVTKDIFNTSLVSKLSARPTSLRCLVSAGLALLSLMPALLQFRNTSNAPHLQSSATHSSSFQTLSGLGINFVFSERPGHSISIDVLCHSLLPFISFTALPEFTFIIGFYSVFPPPTHWMLSYRRVGLELDLLTSIYLVQCLT